MKPILVLRHSPDEPLGNLELVLRAAGMPLDVVDCFSAAWPQAHARGFDPRAWSGLVVMGGPMNVDDVDEHPYLAVEVEWLRTALSADLPTLGVCLGAQMLAKTLGRNVYKNAVDEIGWYEIQLLSAAQDDPLFAGSPARQTVLEWHGDTFDLPEGAVQLARGDTCEVQAFRYGSAYGVQFHPEITAAMVEDWLGGSEMCGKAVAEQRIDANAVRRGAPAGLAAMWPLSERIFKRFAEMCRANA